MSTESTGDMALVQDEDLLRKMWQETDDFGKKKEIRSHMYKIREARLKDFYNAGEETTTSTESKQHSTIKTSHHSSTTGLKGSDLTTHADSLADHSFLSLKSKEIRDSESPTKDSYKIIETRKINDRNWDVIESNEASKDGKTHTTSRIATTSGKQDLDSGEMKYAAKSEQKASVFKDGDDKNFTKSVQASSQNVIKQEASGGDENSKFYSSSTTTSSSSKFSSEQRSSTDDSQKYDTIKSIPGSRPERFTYDDHPGSERESKTVIRKVYTENIPNELKTHPSYVDGNTKVTTETRTLPDGSTVTTTRYETKGATQYSTSSTKTSSARHVSSNEQKNSNDTIIKSHIVSNDDLEDVRSTRSNSISSEKTDKKRTTDSSRKETYHQESDVRRVHDLELLGRDTKDAKNIEIIIKKQNIPQEESRTITTTTHTKTIQPNYNDQKIPDNQGTKTTVITTKTYKIPAEDNEIRSSTIVTKKISSNYDKQQVASTDFLDTERNHVTQTKTTTTPLPTRKEITETETVIRKEITTPSTPKTEPTPVTKIEFQPEPFRKPAETIEIEIVPIRTPSIKEEPKYVQPERRQPIKPGKSELAEKPTPTDGQYETTYRTDYVPRRISVEVSPTHDAFARSLRSISPDRISKTGSVRSLRTTSTTSLRSTSSPDRHPGRTSKISPGDSRPTSPTKKVTKTPEKYPIYTTEIVTKKRPESPEKKIQRPTTKQTEDKHTDTLTKKKKITTTTTETRNEVDSSTLTRKGRPVERPRSRSTSPTSIASDIEFIRHRTDLITDLDTDEITNTKLLRRHTEEFDKQPLPDDTPSKKPQKITDKSATLPLLRKSPSKEPVDSSTDKPKPKTIRRTDTYEERCREILGISNNKDTPNKSLPGEDEPSERPRKPSETIITVTTKDVKPKSPKSPQKKGTDHDIPRDTKKAPSKVQEFPSQIRKSPQKEPLEPYPEKPKDDKRAPSVQEFPSQIRRSPQKEPLEPYPQKPRDSNKEPSVQEFPSQIRRSPQKEPLDPYPEKPKDDRKAPSVQEFPSQTRRSPQKEPFEPYPEKPKDGKKAPSVQEFPSQTRRPPQKEPLEPYPEKPKDGKKAPSVQEFPSQTRKSPQKEPVEPYPAKPRDSKKEPSVQEFPSQTRRSPQKEPLGPYPEKPRDSKKEPSVQEFPSQTRRTPQKEPLEPYPEKPKDDKKAPSVQEFPSQTRRSPQKEPLEPYPEKPKDSKKEPSVQEFPSQTRRTPQKESLEPYPEKPKDDKKAPSVQEFPSQTMRTPQKEPLEPYPEKPRDSKKEPSVQEFPSQTRRSPQKEPLEPYPEKPKDGKKPPTVQEFPSQTRKSPQKEPLEPYPEKPKDDRKQIPSRIQEFPSQVKKPSDSLLPTKKKSPSTRETLEETPDSDTELGDYPDEIDSDIDEPLHRAPSKVSLDDISIIKTEKVSLDDLTKTTTRKPIKETPEKVCLGDLHPKPKPQKVVDNFITNEKIDTEITLKRYQDESIHRPRGIPDVTSTTDAKTTTKKSKIIVKVKKIMPGDETESSTTEDEEQEEVEEIEDQIVEDVETLDIHKTDKRTKTTTRTEEIDERKQPKRPSIKPSYKKPADVDDLESQIIDDETNEIITTSTTTTTTKEVQQKRKPTKDDTVKPKKQPISVTKTPDKAKPKPKSQEPHVEDFITVTKTQLLQTESKVPIEEPVHVKKFITTLCEDEEKDRITQEQVTLIQKERRTKNIPVEEKTPRPSGIVKKDQPEKAGLTPKKTPEKKKPSETFIKREKIDTTVTSKIDSRRIVPKEPSKRPEDRLPFKQPVRKVPDDKKATKSEYMEQYTVKTKDTRVTKPKTTTLTPTKQPITAKKISPKEPQTVTSDTTLHFKVQKVDSTTTKKGLLKLTQVDRRPVVSKTPSAKRPDDQQPKQPAKLRVPEIKQPRATSPSTRTTTIVQKTVEARPPKRHVVSTIINIKPKQKPETITKTIHKTTVTKTILAPKTTKITSRPSKQKPKPTVNGHIYTDEEDSDVESVENLTPKGVSKLPKDQVTPTRSSPLNTAERKKKCITTKSILIENAVADQREIIVDLKRSKSSREGTPDRICPYPISADSDQSIPRYPDRIVEPEDGSQRLKPKRISDIPLDETTDVHDFERITEVAEDRRKITKTRVETTDECLLSVNEKVSKFLNTAEQITKKPLDGKPAPKVDRPRLDVDDSLKEDECLLSVSDKVSRFIATAEQLASSTTKETVQRSKSPRLKDIKPHQAEDLDEPEDYEITMTKTVEVRKSLSPERKPQTVERRFPDHLTRSPERKPEPQTLERTEIDTPKSKSPERKPQPQTIERTEIDTPKAKSPERKPQPQTLGRIEVNAFKAKSPERKPISDTPKSKTPERRPETPDTTRYKTPERKPSDSYSRKTTEEIVKIRKQSFEDETTPKSSRRLSKDEPKAVLSPTGRLRSTETIKKAKALFENIGKEQEVVKQRDILTRPSIFEGRRLKQTEEKIEKVDERKTKDVRTKLTYEEVRRTPSPDKQSQPASRIPRDHSPDEEIPHYMTPLDRTVKEHRTPRRENPDEHDLESLESDRSRGTTPDRNIPHYMLPLDRSLRERSPHKENVKQLEDIMNRSNISTYSDESEIKTTKFGVTLRRTDSGRMVTVHKKLSTSSVDEKLIKELDIEEIFDLEYLEKLLETVVGYDIRRRIRAQIRIIKRAIEEDSLETLITSRRRSPRKESPVRQRQTPDKDEISQVRRYSNTERRKQTEEYVSHHESREVSEYESSYKRKTSSEYSTKTKSPSVSPVRDQREPSPRKEKSLSPECKTTATTHTRIFQTDLKKSKPPTKNLVEEKPEWVTQRTLRKVSETTVPVKKTVTTTTTTQKLISKKDSEGIKQPTDVITSSYGVGPTDENGTPLFGLKALRAQNKSEKTKVQGTVIRSQYYSENGAEPTGEISVTKFSSDPKDLEDENVTRDKGIASVTTTQKFGYKGTPSLKTITGKNKKTTDEDVEYKTSSLKTSKVTRRGSVKEISQKFIENAVDTLKSERQPTYPKAGLILRTSSFKESPTNGTEISRSREGSPATQDVREETVTTVETRTTSSGKKGETFLTNRSKVTGVQDVLSRMRNEAEIEDDETLDDAEAKNLLNKFIGSQVLLSGMESQASIPPGNATRTIKITTTTTSSDSSKPTTITRTFTHPITAELLQNVWDEHTLKLLLEQSTDYEDRKIIRARLLEVMAEQEACAELVKQASEDVPTTKEAGTAQVHGSTTKTTTYTEGPVTTTTQVTTRVAAQEQMKKPMSPFAKFRQLDKQNSLNSPPSTPKSPTTGSPLFKFTDASLNQSANTVRQRLLQWCQMKTKEYENIQLDNFSTSWSDGMAFCALIHHFLPDSFDYNTLNPKNRRHNFTLAFQVADEKAGIAPLLDVDDMVAISRPDWKCVFTYVQSIYRRFKDED